MLKRRFYIFSLYHLIDTVYSKDIVYKSNNFNKTRKEFYRLVDTIEDFRQTYYFVDNKAKKCYSPEEFDAFINMLPRKGEFDF